MRSQYYLNFIILEIQNDGQRSNKHYFIDYGLFLFYTDNFKFYFPQYLSHDLYITQQ